MKPFAKLFAATLIFGALGFLLSLIPQKTANGVTPTPVDVTNTPLPVKGDVTATITGTPSVKVTSLPHVDATVTGFSNTSSNPLYVKDVSNPGLNPVTINISVPYNPTYIVPSSDGELVIDYISGYCNINGSQFPIISLETTVGNSGSVVSFVFSLYPGDSGLAEFAQVTALYADPGTKVTRAAATDASSGCFANLMGHFVSH